MKVLVVSNELIGSALCHRLIREGHDVKLYIEDEACRSSLEGIVPKCLDWKVELEWVQKDGLVVFDDVGFGAEAEDLRQKGYRVVGGSSASDTMELNRGHFQKILHEHGIPVLPSYDFETADEAIEFVKSNPGPWVVKQNTHYGVLNHVGEAEDSSDVIQILKSYKSIGLSAHLQRKAVGVEVAVGRFYNGNGWVGPICVNHEHKRLCSGDIGPLTPEMGTVVWFVEDEPEIYKRTLKILEPLLKEINYKGYFDINCIADEDNIWPLEATARFGSPITELQMELLESGLIDFLCAIADGTDFSPDFYKGFGMTVSIVLPPFPFKKNQTIHNDLVKGGTPILFDKNMTEEEFSSIYLEEVSKSNGTSPLPQGTYYWAGNNGWVMHVTGKDKTIPKARSKVYEIIDKIILPMKFYRGDIGDRVNVRDIPLLKKWKLIHQPNWNDWFYTG